MLFAASNYIFAQNSPHGNLLQFECASCHLNSDWSDISKDTFNHDLTGYALNGAHIKVNCSSCHKSLVFNEISSDCISCHTDIHKNELGTSCHMCHSDHKWDDKSEFINFHNQTDFPLTGVHVRLDCESCHLYEQQAQYANTPVECPACHLSAYNSSTNLDHHIFDFSVDCESCHSTTSWGPTFFNHLSASTFALEGRHKEVSCALCHQNNQLTGFPQDCNGCHQSEYDNSTDPNHLGVSFSAVCQECHTPKDWRPAHWDHDVSYFPINSGRHRNVWDNCSDCHVNSANYGQFECINCHAHRQSRMDSKHRNRFNYIYESQACYDCHPKGRED